MTTTFYLPSLSAFAVTLFIIFIIFLKVSPYKFTGQLSENNMAIQLFMCIFVSIKAEEETT